MFTSIDITISRLLMIANMEPNDDRLMEPAWRLGEFDRAIAKAQGWLEKGALAEDSELAVHFGKTPVAATSGSLVLPYAEEVEKWFENGIQGTTIHQALELKYGFSDSYSCVRRFLAALKAANPARCTFYHSKQNAG